jgi:hypothetical protein
MGKIEAGGIYARNGKSISRSYTEQTRRSTEKINLELEINTLIPGARYLKSIFANSD